MVRENLSLSGSGLCSSMPAMEMVAASPVTSIAKRALEAPMRAPRFPSPWSKIMMSSIPSGDPFPVTMVVEEYFLTE